ncbi:MAG: hypothetical protein ACK5E7_01390, partial [Cyclobacteriaceae bacterium]
PDTEYETRAQGMKAGVFGPYTDVIKFRTTPLRVAQCGQPTVLPTSTGKPIPFLTSGMVINARGMELQIVNASVADVDGWYKGTGRVSVPYLGGAVFNVKFDRIFIDADRNVTAGRIDFITKGVAAMVEQQLAGQQNRERERKQRANREQWKDVVFYEKIFKYDMPIISAVVGDNDAIVLYDQQNIQHINRDIATVLQEHPGKAVVIEDKNGEQYVVQKDKTTGKTTVTKVEGGGLRPSGNINLPNDVVEIVKKAIRSLRDQYSNSVIAQKNTQLVSQKSELKAIIDTNNKKFLPQANPATTEPQDFLFDLEEVAIAETFPENDFDSKSREIKKSELELNRMTLIRLLADNIDTREDYKMIASELIIDNLGVTDFVAAQKAKGVSEQEIVKNISTEIVNFVDQIFIDYSRSK